VPPRSRSIRLGTLAATLWLLGASYAHACTIPADIINNIVETFDEPDDRFESEFTKVTNGKLRVTPEPDPQTPVTALEPGSYTDFDACVMVENKEAVFYQDYKAWGGLAFWGNEEGNRLLCFRGRCKGCLCRAAVQERRTNRACRVDQERCNQAGDHAQSGGG
jgi:hypothetical protein